MLGRFREELEQRHRWERVSLGIERKGGEAYRAALEGSEERATSAARTDGFSVGYNPHVDWERGSHWVWEERLAQVREVDGELAYEKMRRALEMAKQPLSISQFPSREGPQRSGPEHDFGPSR